MLRQRRHDDWRVLPMSVKLEEYSEKRNFDKTPEPVGEADLVGKANSVGLADRPGEFLRFAVQHHRARPGPL